MEYAQQTIIDFLSGNLNIVEFRHLYDEKPEIDAFLQKIIDDMKKDYSRKILCFPFMIAGVENQYIEAVPYLLDPKTDPGRQYCPPRYESVRQCLTYEYRLFTHDVETACGATTFYNEVYSIYYQIDQSVPFCDKYGDAYRFAIEVIPEYLEGGASEKYIQKYIIPLFPETMKKTERIKAIKAKIKETFKSEKGYPCWPQSSEWPMDKEGKPCTYIGKGKSQGDLRRFRFRDETTGEEIVIEQFC
ncbi:MAG: hypothetical protein J6L87_08485 [Clostridia bacterium]|nr:hypothetical protein [Clostridia bacterium]